MLKEHIILFGKHTLVVILFLLAGTVPVKAYSLLTHEAIIDVSWKTSIEPLLLQKYPGSTEEDLQLAHSYAYGGAIMPDIGYSPFGSKLYTNLVHNVSTGDYVLVLLEEAGDINEYAFALGSLAHYTADIHGHLLGTNIAVPVTYPKLRSEYGNVITYAEHPKSHSRVELAFDVLQTARGNYATKAYHDFIGFKIAIPVVERAFQKTYGLEVRDVFKSLPLAISTYRWVVKSLLPNIVRTAWASKKGDLKKANPGVTAQNFSFRMKNREYYEQYGRDLQKAGFIPTIISVIVPILPKVGPLAKLRFKAPSAETEKLFIKSFDSTLKNYELSLKALISAAPPFPNTLLDTGTEIAYGEYSIADDTHYELLSRVVKSDYGDINSAARKNLTVFYSSPRPEPNSRKDRKKEAFIKEALTRLNSASEIK